MMSKPTTWRLGFTLALALIIALMNWPGLWRDAAMLNLANVAVMKGLRAGTVGNIAWLADHGPTTARLARAEGIALFWAGQPGQAVAAFEHAAALEGGDAHPVTQLWLGAAYQATGDLAAAIPAWERAGGARVLARQGDALRQAGQLADATIVFQAAVDLHADAADGYAGLGQIAVERQDWRTAEARFAEALMLDASCVEALTGLATVYVQSGRYADARVYLEHAITLKPDAIMAYLVMGDTFGRQGDPVTARAWYDRSAARFPASPAPDIRLALAAIAQGQPQQAFAALDAAGQKDPHSAQRYIGLARAYRLAGGPEGLASAIGALEQAVNLAPNNLWSWVWLGDGYREAGRCGDAQGAYTRAAQLDPANAQVAAHQAAPCSSESTTDMASSTEALP
jgi:tetratricopeptide (TPR) repeat protein